MKWKYAAASVAVAAIASAPFAAAAPKGDNGNGHKPVSPPGQSISQIAKTGGGATGVLGALVTAKPSNPGLPNALQHVTANSTSQTTTTVAPTG